MVPVQGLIEKGRLAGILLRKYPQPLGIRAAPDYSQLEFDLRAYFCLLKADGKSLWLPAEIGTASSVSRGGTCFLVGKY